MEQLIKALIKAKSEFKPIVKDRNGARSKYATLDSVHSSIDKALLDNNLLLTQPMRFEDGQHVLQTWIWHISGDSISSDYYPIQQNNDPQKMGAAITYARRYQLCAMLGITADEDTDAEGVSTNAVPKSAAKSTPKAVNPHKAVIDENIQTARDEGLSVTEIKSLCKAHNLPDSSAKPWKKEQVATLAQIIQDEIAQRKQEKAA